MLPTHSLGSLKSGLQGLVHPQLPLTPRESQKLLKALTSSFRKHLDKEHGWAQEDALAASRAPGHRRLYAPAPSAASMPKPPSHRDAHRRPTDRHLRTILSNPLFSSSPAGQHQLDPTSASVPPERDPMQVFEQAVARGLMTPRRAAGCLEAKRRNLVQSGSISVQQAMADCRAAPQVIQWLRSSGMERDLSFVAHAGLTSLLLRFMVAEDMEEIAWSWLTRLARGEGPQGPVKNHQTAASFVLDEIITTKAAEATSLNDAYTSILRGEDLFKSTPKIETRLLEPWRHLSWLSTGDAWRRMNPTSSLYDAFVAMSYRMRVPGLDIERAHLDLHHPTKPTSQNAEEMLHRDSTWQDFVPDHPIDKVLAPDERPSYYGFKIMTMGLDTVRHLTQVGKASEAQNLFELLRERFGTRTDGVALG